MPTLSECEAFADPFAFLDWWAGRWEQGQHVLVQGMTGAG